MTEPTPDPTILAEIHSPVDATVESEGDHGTLLMKRHFQQSPARLWHMITEPDELVRWSPVVPNRPLTSPGAAMCHESPEQKWIDAEVLLANEPYELVHRWGQDILRWTITPSESGSTLELRHTFADRSAASMFAAGWQVCLGTLAATHDNADRERVVGQRALAYGWSELNDHYASRWTGEDA
ncbi:MAG: SRPBCC domain-containing protein [Thermomicrobiales bacterium]|nr:SRPBCC domain-containing protein [Thermomicrobiales bacterium]